jgi:polyisoprenoid-binding protein YceI
MRVTFVGAVLVAAAATFSTRRYELDPVTSKVWLDASATMGSFSGRSNKLTGWLETGEPGYVDVRAHIELEAASLKTGIGLRDGHLRGELDTDKYPTITVEVDSTREDSTTYHHVWARLTVRGNAHTFETTAQVLEHGDTIVVSGKFPMSFTSLGMKPPSKLLGTVKVKNDFSIGFECAFHRNE